MAQLTFPSKQKYRTDLLVLWDGIFFSMAFTGVIWRFGARLGRLIRNWRSPDAEVASIT